MANPTLEECAEAAGSINNPADVSTTAVVVSSTTYIAPDLCVGENIVADPTCIDETAYQQSVAAENLLASGAPVNIFKLLGIHEQGRLVDLTGLGNAIGSGTPNAAFDSLAGTWTSSQTGLSVVTDPAWIGYDFGIRKTSFGLPENAPDGNVLQHITSFRITQGVDAVNRALQVRVDRSTGGYCIDPLKVQFTGTGNGGMGDFRAGVHPKPGTLMLMANSPTSFSVIFTAPGTTTVLGQATVGKRFNATIGSFIIRAGTIPFADGDMFSATIELEWLRVDVVNLPNLPTPALIRIKQSAPSRYWRLVPLSFGGSSVDEPWEIQKLELFDYLATRLDDIQDTLFMENRDRDYAKVSLQLKASYTPFDSMMDMSKFGFQVGDVYTFTTSFALMVALLGRPIVVGDVLELPNEMQWDHNMKPVRRFLEVSDVGWSADGYTASWQPILYRFQAQQLIPSQEHRDIIGTVNTQKYTIDDGKFFSGVDQQIQTTPLTVTEANYQDAYKAVPEKGTNIQEAASGANRNGLPGSFDGVGPYVESGLPPDGQPYVTVYDRLPDIATAQDGDFARLERDPKLGIPATLYKFNGVKNVWQYASTDRRPKNSSHKPSELEIFNSEHKFSLTTKKIS